MQKKIAVVALNDAFRRSWIDTGILSELSESQDISLFTCFDNSYEMPNVDLRKFLDPNGIKRVTLLKNLVWIAYRDRCISFKFNLTRWYLSNFFWYQKKMPLVLRFKYLIRQIGLFLRKFFIENKLSVFYFIPFKKFFIRIMLNRFKGTIELERLFSEFDLVIFHSCTLEKEFPLIQQSLKKSNTKTLMVLESWDNLTSKQIFLFKPNYIGVIGQLDVSNAMRIHGFEQNQIFQVGLPKFEILKRFQYDLERTGNSKTILYVGFFLPHDEISLLNQLQKTLSSLDENFQILYRPHPGAKKRLFMEQLDPRVQITKKWSTTELPPLDSDYMSDVLDADVVIGPPTTFLLESMLIGIPTLIDLTNDGIHRTTSSNSAKNYLHIMQFVSMLDQITFSSTDQIRDLIFNSSVDKNYLTSALDSIVHQDDLTYAKRLDKIINLIL
jgi:hypothetical protein